jgi:flagellar protein FliO/FliZ
MATPSCPVNLKRACLCIKALLLAALYSPLLAMAQIAPARPVYTPPPDAVSFGSMLQVIFSLLLVLGAVVLVAWLIKRLNMPQHGAASLLKVISGVAVGQRERVVLIEVKDTWLVVGVAPGQVRVLHSMSKSDIPAEPVGAHTAADVKNFQSWLKQMVEKRNAG